MRASRARADDTAKGAAATTGLAGVAAILGLVGAVCGAAVGRREVTGEGLRRRGHPRGERRAYTGEGAAASGVAYTDERGTVMTHPPDVTTRPEDANLHH